MYGENGGRLRAELAVLLRQHRIQHRLGGQGLHTVPESTTVEEREDLGQQIGRYRQAVLVWCLQAVRAASPGTTIQETSTRTRSPAEELRFRLDVTLKSSQATLPPLKELVTEQAFPIVETWRQAARAAALGEHDFGAGLSYGLLSDAQCATVLRDAAEVTRAIVALDRRYANIPGWRPLKDPGRLGWAAEACANFARNAEPDYTVDRRGWRLGPRTIDGPASPGIAGVMQAEHNLLVHLGRFPDAHSLRIVLISQHIVSRTAATLIKPSDPERAAGWRDRESTYQRLIRETRDLGGQLGNGGLAAGQGSVAAARVQRLPPSAFNSMTLGRRLDMLFARVDQQLSEIIEHGAKERLYFLRVPLPRVDQIATGLVKPPRERYAPVTSSVGPNLIALAREHLRPKLIEPRPPAGAAQSRAEFRAAIDHRPEGRGGPGAIGV